MCIYMINCLAGHKADHDDRVRCGVETVNNVVGIVNDELTTLEWVDDSET